MKLCVTRAIQAVSRLSSLAVHHMRPCLRQMPHGDQWQHQEAPRPACERRDLAGLLSLKQDAAKRTRAAGQRLPGLVRQLSREESIATKLCWRLVDIAPGELG